MVYKVIKQTTRKYYKTWAQPVLSSNGTMGGNSFAVEGAAYDGNTTEVPAYGCFDNGNKEWWCSSNHNYYEVYNPEPLCITNFQITYVSNFGTWNFALLSCTIKGSNDGSTWTTVKTFSNLTGSAGSTVNLSVSENSNFYKYYMIDDIVCINAPSGYSFGPRISEMVLTATAEGSSSDYDYYEDINEYKIANGTRYYKYKEVASGYRQLTTIAGLGAVTSLNAISTNTTSFEGKLGIIDKQDYTYFFTNSSGGGSWYIFGYEQVSADEFSMHYKDAVYYTTFKPNVNQLYNIRGDFSGSTKKIYVEGSQVLSINDSSQETWSQLRIDNAGGRTIFGYLKFLDSSMNIIAELFPCERVSDNVIGFYDTVSSTFYPNTGIKGDYVLEQGTPSDYDYTEVGPEYYRYNISQVGTLTKNKSVISGFSASSYADTGYSLNPNGDWSLAIGFITGSDIISEGNLLAGRLAGNTGREGMSVALTNGIIRAWFGDGISSWIIDGSLEGSSPSLQPNHKYIWECKYESGVYSFALDGVTYFTKTSSTKVKNNHTILLGYDLRFDSHYFRGSIDLKSSYITDGSVKVWEGVTKTTASDIIWTQPTLTANGTMGGSTAAASASSSYQGWDAYKAFDGNNSDWWGPSTRYNTVTLNFYNPEPIIPSQIDINFRNTSEAHRYVYVYGGNTSNPSTQIAVYDNSDQKAVISIPITNQIPCKYITFQFTTPSEPNWGAVTDINIIADKYEYYVITDGRLVQTVDPTPPAPAFEMIWVDTGKTIVSGSTTDFCAGTGSITLAQPESGANAVRLNCSDWSIPKTFKITGSAGGVQGSMFIMTPSGSQYVSGTFISYPNTVQVSIPNDIDRSTIQYISFYTMNNEQVTFSDLIVYDNNDNIIIPAS